MKIPKIIWQTWKNYQVPEKWRPSLDSIQKFCPGWEHRLTSDQDNLEFVRDHFPEYLKLYLSFDREIYRVDMVRYLYLYKYGGVYLDLDMELIRPLEQLLVGDSDLYLVRTSNFGGYTNAFMASSPKQEFWLKSIQEIIHRTQNRPWYVIGDLKVLWTTGPQMITSVASKYNHPFTTIPYLLGHPCSVCDNYNGTGDLSQAYVRELEGSSWSVTAGIAHYFLCRWQIVLGIVILLIIALLFFFLVKR